MRITASPPLADRSWSHRDFILSAAIVMVAIAWSAYLIDGRRMLTTDSGILLSISQNIAEGNGIHTSRLSHSENDGEPFRVQPEITKPPLYPTVIAGMVKLGISPKVAGWGVSQGAFIASALFFYLLARTFLPASSAFLAAIAATIQVSTVVRAVDAREETLFLALVLLSLFLYQKFRSRSAAHSTAGLFLVGIVAGSALLTRYVGVSLLFAITAAIVLEGSRLRQVVRALAVFSAGIALVGVIPAYRFFTIRFGGHETAFVSNPDPTWYETLASMLHAAQTHFFGSQFIWLRDPSTIDIVFIAAAIIGLALLLAHSLRNADSRLVALFVAIYLIVLYVRLAAAGFSLYEPRYSVPVNGLIILLVVRIIYTGITGRSTRVRRAAVVFAIGASIVYGGGQAFAAKTFLVYPDGPDSSRAHCIVTESVAWLRQHAQRGDVVMATEGFYQAMAEQNFVRWLPIAPATFYDGESAFKNRWSEQTFRTKAEASGAKFVIILSCGAGDRIVQRYGGYGSFVTDLSNGIHPNWMVPVLESQEARLYRVGD